ncbi:hypothetical protein [Solemya velum gill symbiont]|uniref:hypothetical protein n=1 Tax=Solemya velum gill symbiont TaxID=2340 RepID=UPI000997AF2B|nr:hypothetical protein [Solemya velum gill symbiont]OOZ44793.1 hypothetical protein BOW37_05800 [Solemya velum gill symbiont]OOZ45787.1 hypothetical protein BOW38_08910 [Solemya velum gill symbiont]OOZ50621.1 hypothetical protein BOW39_02380 [Solemya velum gill symbiont]OOZ51866.1 hypothetical protein BOW40_05855 [Solemya velum gill symbiont]OOZ54409.1 hypothetical protein BOW41_06565 [Solemya velum gill symbiont]
MKKVILLLLVLAVASVSVHAASVSGSVGGNIVVVKDDNYYGTGGDIDLKPGNKVVLDSRTESIEITWESGCGSPGPTTIKFLGAQVIQITPQAPFCCRAGEVVSMVSDSSGNNTQQCTRDWSVAQEETPKKSYGDKQRAKESGSGGGVIAVLTGGLLIGAGAAFAGDVTQ